MKAVTFFLALFLPAIVSGQDRPDPFSTARLRVGPLALTPTISLGNLGIDTNVFNDAENPKRDLTTTLSPQTQLWLRLGKGRLSGETRLDFAYFRRYANQRAVNAYNEIRAELPLNRLTAFVTNSFLSARERPGYEIDTRARHLENTVTLGTNVRVGPKTTVGFAAWHTNISFDADEVFLGTNLSEGLNHTANGLRASVQRKLTPLTALVIVAEAQRDRFGFSSVRNSDSVRIMPGLELDPFALISGSASVGYRKFDALSPGAPKGFRGLVAAADLGYILLGVTRFSVHTERDIAYSFSFDEPRYVQTGARGTVTQKVTGRWDVQATLSRYRLDYQSVAALDSGHAELVRTVGAGVGYTTGRRTRISVNLDRHRRTSNRDFREYSGSRLGTSVTYGF